MIIGHMITTIILGAIKVEEVEDFNLKKVKIV